MMLKEVVEMSKYMNATDLRGSHNQATEFQMKCEENISNYKAMVEKNFDKLVSQGDDQTKALAEKYNISALQEKIKGFKFAKANADQTASTKDANWFQKLQES